MSTNLILKKELLSKQTMQVILKRNVEKRGIRDRGSEPRRIYGKREWMPVIIPNNAYGSWVTLTGNGRSFQEYLKPFSLYKMTAYPVSTMAYEVKNDRAGCIRKIDYWQNWRLLR